MPQNPYLCPRLLISRNAARRLVLATGMILSVLACMGMLPASAMAKENPKYASIVMDADTGLILHQSNPDKKLHPASLTKVMTLLMVFEAIDQGRLGLNDRIRISKHAAGMAPSKLGLKPGSTIKVKDGIYALVTKSANDISAAFAEHLGGTESGFARLMTARAHELGMANTTFRNASGLHNPGQVSSARDMAKLARFVITHHPDSYRYFATKNFSYGGHNYHNHNRLMDSYKGMDGMKTGYIGPSGFNLVASAVRGNHRLIGVVFGGRSTGSRNAHMANLLDNGFTKVGDVLIANAEQNKPPIPPRKPGILLALSTLNNTVPAAGDRQLPAAMQSFAALSPAPVIAATPRIAPPPALPEKAGSFGELTGEGDADPAAAHRIETGLMAIAAHTHTGGKPATPGALTNPSSTWAIQIGAFTSRAATDRALNTALKKLPGKYADASPVIAPMKTDEGWLFRARLSGYTKAQAFGACGYVKDCLPVAPQNN